MLLITKEKAEKLAKIYKDKYNCPPKMKDYTATSDFCDKKLIIRLYGSWSNYLLALGYTKDSRNRVLKPGPGPKATYIKKRITPKLKKHLLSLDLSDKDLSFIKGCLRCQDNSGQLTELQFNRILYMQSNKYSKDI